MAKKIIHLSVNIEWILEHKEITFMEKGGQKLTDMQAREELARLQEMGHKLICTSDNCEGFDPFGGGCPGHLVEEEASNG